MSEILIFQFGHVQFGRLLGCRNFFQKRLLDGTNSGLRKKLLWLFKARLGTLSGYYNWWRINYYVRISGFHAVLTNNTILYLKLSSRKFFCHIRAKKEDWSRFSFLAPLLKTEQQRLVKQVGEERPKTLFGRRTIIFWVVYWWRRKTKTPLNQVF